MGRGAKLGGHLRLGLAARPASLAVGAVGVGVLVLWQVAPRFLIAYVPGQVVMVPLTAFAFVIYAAGLWLALQPAPWQRRASFWLGVLVLAMGAGTLLEYVLGIDLGLDRLPFPERVPFADMAGYVGRAAPNTAVMLAFLGLGLARIDAAPFGRFWPAEACAAAAAVLPYLAVLGYAYQLEVLARLSPFIAMALPSALTGLVAILALLAARPDRGFMARLTTQEAGGLIRRRFWPAALVVPPLLAWLTLRGEGTGQGGPELDEALLILVLSFLGMLAIETCAVAIDQLDEERRRTLAEVQDLYENAPCGYQSLGPDGRIRRINATELRWLGYERDEVVGRMPFEAILAPESRPLFRTRFEELKACGRVDDVEYELIRKDGSRLTVVVNATAIRDAEGRFVASRSTLFDVTLRKQVEAELRRSEASLAEAQRLTHLGNWERDLVSGRMTWSDETYRLFHLEPGTVELDQELVYARIHPADRGRVEAVAEEAIRLGSSFYLNYRLQQPDGGVAYIHARGEVVLDTQGQPVRVFGTLQDVTELRRAQEALARKAVDLERMHELGRLKDRFLSGVSHELKTPLAAIVGFAELLEDTYPDDPHVGRVMEGAQRLSDRLTSIIDYSALLGDGLPMVTTEIAPHELITSAAGCLQQAFDRKGVALEVQVAPGLPMVQADPRRMHQALHELLKNALQFTPRGAKAGVTASTDGGQVVFEVWDQGPGIPAAELPKIWDAFARVELPEVPREGGMGLGLAIARAIVERHGGSLAATARQPHGMSFRVALPALAPASPSGRA